MNNENSQKKLNAGIKIVIVLFSWFISIFPSLFLSSYIAKMQFSSLDKIKYAARQWTAILTLPITFIIYKLIVVFIQKLKKIDQ